MYPMLMAGVSCTQSSRFLQRRVGVPTRPPIPIFRLRPSPFRPASDLNNLLIVVSVVFPSPRLLIDVVMPPLLFYSFWSILRFPVTSILSPHPSGCRLSVLRCSYSYASSPHRQIFVSASPPPPPPPSSSYYLSSIISLSLLSLSWRFVWISHCYIGAQEFALRGDVLSQT
jgi:hypothetical protein